MNIKRRLALYNTATILIPIVITIIVTGFCILFFSRFLNRDLGYNTFKRIGSIRSELISIAGSVSQNEPEILGEKDFEDYLSKSLGAIDGKYIILKDSIVLSSSKDINKIDQEKIIQTSEEKSIDKSIKINNMNYIIETIKFPGNNGVILLAPIGRESHLFKKFLIFVSAIFILSFITANGIMSYLFSKRILSPISQLKKAASEISSGNLKYEMVEDGDEEIRELCAAFEKMRIQLKDSVNMRIKYDENRRVLISSISHDLKTPITSIKGYVEGILDGIANTPEKMENYLKTIYSKAEYVDFMIDDLLLYSKLDLNQIPFNFEETDIVFYFEYCINETRGELLKYGININLLNELKASRKVMIDRERMRRVIINIIDNSRKYMDKNNGEINIILRETSSSIIVELRDNGKGIEGNDINKIFQRFYRGDEARSGSKGSGLGLAIAKQIVEGHEGRIWAVSHGNEGTSILISLKK